MKRKTLITKVVLDLGSRQIELTMDEARDLFDSLSDVFGPKTTAIPCPYPIYVERPNRWYWQYPSPVWGTATICSTAYPNGSTATSVPQFSMQNNTLTLKALNSAGGNYDNGLT